MNLPIVNETTQNRIFIQQFKGYNHNLRSDSGEFFDMKNMTTDHYPVLCTRQGVAEQTGFPGNPNGLWEYETNKLMVISGGEIYYDISTGSKYPFFPKAQLKLEDSPKYFAQIGTKTIIMPDKVVFDADYKTVEPIEIEGSSDSVQALDGTVYSVLKAEPCDLEGITYTPYKGNEAPEDLSLYWYDTTSEFLKKYSAATESWVIVDTPYMKVSFEVSLSDSSYVPADKTKYSAAIESLNIEDAVKVFNSMEVLDTVTIKLGEQDTTDYVVYGSGEETNNLGTNRYLVIVGYPDKEIYTFSVKRKCPNLTHICSLNNRIWGVDNELHELYCCKQGNPTQWYNYAGLASDSYAMSLPSTAAITGCSSYNNLVLFFTEDRLFKVYGSTPSSFQVSETKCDGIVTGGSRTVQVVENALYYVSPIGVMSYDGSFPTLISKVFSPDFLTGMDLVAGRDRTKYCLSVSKNEEPKGVYMYDTLNGLWVVGGYQIFKQTSRLNNALVFLNNNSQLITLHDREKEYDEIGAVSENLFSLNRSMYEA